MAEPTRARVARGPAVRRGRLDVRLTAAVACAGCASKLGPGDLRKALHGLSPSRRDPRVMVDQNTYDDAGVFRLDRGRALVQTVDFFTPVVNDPFDFGRIAATNALSDVYAMGGTPLTALGIVAFPDGTLAPEVLREVMRGGQRVMDRAGVSVIGGHSVKDAELKFGYSVTGIVDPKRVLTNAGARPGDRLVLTKPLGTGVLATALKHGKLDPVLERRMIRQMTTLNREASRAAVAAGARAATDVTGFGLMGHGSQLARASGVTVRLDPRADWFLPQVIDLALAGEVAGGLRDNREFYRSFVSMRGIDEGTELALYDPQTSGGLLIAIPAARTARLEAGLRRARVWHRWIGEVVRKGPHPVEVGK
ncbi:MAG: selenide, water dikinase SelD [Candidatus Eisenbacteria bacterium]|uniref:Selenide, water dikinase n=1 Tax=Eiseniibacteriota bacterium TaxID=2212470 RepID=A0A849SRF5_UNCEI|nr:selenide, water dikinase SelD [Candidatus Eisenbacteria bacterium]